jgi:hypothetical protein
MRKKFSSPLAFFAPLLFLAAVLIGPALAAYAAPEKEFLTEKEIKKIQESQDVDWRVKIYMDAASLRLKSAEERLTGKESKEGDPLEFFSPEEMLDSYYRIMRSLMYNLDDAFQKPGKGREKIGKALKSLKDGTESAGKELEILKKIAEDQKKEELWNSVNQAIDITNGAHEGAIYGLSKEPSLEKKATGKKGTGAK